MLGVDPTKADDDFKITRFWMEGGKPMFEFSHSTDGAGKSFVTRINVKGRQSCLMGGVMFLKAAIRHSGSLRLR